MQKKFGDPKCPLTRVPMLDKMVKDRMFQDATELDRTLARLQALFLDTVGLLAAGKQEELSVDRAVMAAKTALRFLGNA